MDEVGFITTATDDWVQQCGAFANANQVFEIRGIRSFHFDFIQDLCKRHDYRFKYGMREDELFAVLMPLVRSFRDLRRKGRLWGSKWENLN
jgi:hypothetical protein